MTPSNQAISSYYNGMSIFYRWFYSAAGLHYGLWHPGTWTLRQALVNHKKAVFAELGAISSDSHILDAGCGEGRTAICFSRWAGCRVTGITLSATQVARARRHATRRQMTERARFLGADFTATPFLDQSFTHAFASESFCHARDKPAFLGEMYRLLKPGGRLVIADFFLHQPETSLNQRRRRCYEVVKRGFVIPGFASCGQMDSWIGDSGFTRLRDTDITRAVRRTAYHIQARAVPALPLAWLLRGMRLAPPELVPHLLCCAIQPIALRELGCYRLITLEKPAERRG